MRSSTLNFCPSPLRSTAAPQQPPQRAAHPTPDHTRRQWSSDQLFGPLHEIEIAHGDSIYRLRVTSLGKLILTK